MNRFYKPFKKQQLSLAVLMALALTFSACGGSDSGDDTNQTSTQNDNTQNQNTQNNNDNTDLTFNSAIAKDFVDNLAIPAYRSFAKQATGLSANIKSYCDAIGKGNEGTAKAGAQKSSVALKNAWQATQVYNVLTTNNAVANNIYTRNNFDAATASLIAAQVAKRKSDANYQLTNNVSTKAGGLDAIEYLLNQQETSNSAKLDNCNYAVAVANDVKKNADVMVSTWQAQRNSLLTPSESNGVDLIQPFFNNFANLIDVEIKTNDIAIPASLKSGGSCTAPACPNLLENKLSKSSYGSIKARLQGIKAMMTGSGANKGFKAFYAKKNMASEAQAFEKLIDNAIATINTQNTSLYDQLSAIKTNNKATACSAVANSGKTTDADLAPCKLYYQVKQISDEVKSGSFKLAVNLSLPSAAAGDGD